MKSVVYDLTFITPALTGGAYPKSEGERQAGAEIRAPSIRGQMRWWFRFLGHSENDANRIFGSVAGDTCHASGFILRLLDLPEPINRPKTARDLGLHSRQIVEYLAFNLRNNQDARSVYPAGTKFTATLINRSLSESDWKHLLELTRIYFQLGSLGTRSRRGFGAIEMLAENGETPSSPTTDRLACSAISLRTVEEFQSANDPTAFLIKAGNWLRDKRQALGKDKDELLGYVKGSRRKASPVLLRPVRSDRGLKLVLIGEKSKVERILS